MTRRREHRGHGLTTDGAPDQQAELKEVRIEEKTLDENKGVGVKEETSTYFIHWQTYWRMFGSAAHHAECLAYREEDVTTTSWLQQMQIVCQGPHGGHVGALR